MLHPIRKNALSLSNLTHFQSPNIYQYIVIILNHFQIGNVIWATWPIFIKNGVTFEFSCFIFMVDNEGAAFP